jgi:hypothetical protein
MGIREKLIDINESDILSELTPAGKKQLKWLKDTTKKVADSTKERIKKITKNMNTHDMERIGKKNDIPSQPTPSSKQEFDVKKVKQVPMSKETPKRVIIAKALKNKTSQQIASNIVSGKKNKLPDTRPKPTQGPLKSKVSISNNIPSQPIPNDNIKQVSMGSETPKRTIIASALKSKAREYAEKGLRIGKDYAKQGIDYAKREPVKVAGGAAAIAAGLGAVMLAKKLRAKKKAAAKKAENKK